jgi:hypothetical protein
MVWSITGRKALFSVFIASFCFASVEQTYKEKIAISL